MKLITIEKPWMEKPKKKTINEIEENEKYYALQQPFKPLDELSIADYTVIYGCKSDSLLCVGCIPTCSTDGLWL